MNNKEGISGYVGTTLGLFFPDEESVNTGFGGNLYSWCQIQSILCYRCRIALLGSETDLSDISYWAWGLFLNPTIYFTF